MNGVDFSHFFNNVKFSDVKFKVGDREFKGHRIVLSTASSKFATMFDRHPEANHMFTITDINDDIFELLLKCIYKNNNIDLFVISESVEQLLEASDKYRIHELKYRCEEFLSHQLTQTNVTDFMTLADHCNAQKLKLKAFEFIKNSS